MRNFFGSQLDYIYFCYGLAFFILASVCLLLVKTRSHDKVPWLWLGLFAMAHGIAEWLDLTATYTGEIRIFNFIRTGFVFLSFIFLSEFGRLSFFILCNKTVKRQVYLPAILIAGWGYLFYGLPGFSTFSRYLFGFVGGLTASFILFHIAKKFADTINAAVWLKRVAIALGIYSFTHILSPQADFFPAAVLNYNTFFNTTGIPVALLRGVIAFWIAITLWCYWNFYDRETPVYRRKIFLTYSVLFTILFFLILLFGWCYTEHLKRKELQDVKLDTLNKALLGSSMLDFQNIPLLSGSADDHGKLPFENLKLQLKALRDSNPYYRFVCLLGMKQEKVFFYVDAEPPDSKDYSPPGQIYEEVPLQVRETFVTGESLFIGPFTDRWGSWYSAFVAVRDPHTAQILAVLEIDNDAKKTGSRLILARLGGIVFTILLTSFLLSLFTILILRKEAAFMSAASEDRFRITFENAPESVFIFDVKIGVILEINPFMVSWLGFSREECLKKTVDDLFLRAIEWRPKNKNNARDRDEIFTTENFCRKKDKDASSNVELVGVRLNFLTRDCVLVFMRDITERKKAEARIKDFAYQLQVVVNSVGDGITFSDTKGRFYVYNSRMKEITGYTMEEANGCGDFLSLLYPDSAGRRKALERLSEFGDDSSRKEVETVIRTKDGSQKILLVSTMKMRYQERPMFLSVYRDMTARYQAERALQTANQELTASEKTLKNMLANLNKTHEELKAAQSQLLQSEKLAAIGQLAAGIAHEINNPIGFINSNLETLERYIDSYSELLRATDLLKRAVEARDINKAQAIVEEIKTLEEKANLNFITSDIDNLLRESKSGVTRIRKILMDLRTFSRKDKGVMGPINVEEVLDGIINIVWNEIKYTAELKKEYGKVPSVIGNAQKLGQVFINILINAVQAIKGKGVIEVKTFVQKGYACVQISDTGYGIPPENLDKIFDPFFTTKPVGKGTGLGLSISYDIIKQHGGDILVQSEVNKGSQFTVRLPLQTS